MKLKPGFYCGDKMCPFKFFIFVIILGFCYFVQVKETTALPPPKIRDLRDIFRIKPPSNSKQTLRISPTTQTRRAQVPKMNAVQQPRQIQRRDVPFQQTFLGVPVQIENVHHNSGEIPANHPIKNLYPSLPVPGLPGPAVKPLIKPNETEAERAERIHKSFDRLLTFVEIVGQVDNYVSSKWKNLVKTVSNFYEAEDEPYRVSAKRIYGTCPHAH